MPKKTRTLKKKTNCTDEKYANNNKILMSCSIERHLCKQRERALGFRQV